MHWVMVEGYPLPKSIGGHAALDFCNTWSGWHAGWKPEPLDPKREWLQSYDRFAVWAGHAGVLPDDEVARMRASAGTPAAGAVLGRAHRFRQALYRVLTGDDAGSVFDDVAAVTDQAARASVLAPTFTRELPPGLGVALPLLAVARAAEALLTSPARAEVRACPGDDCGWLFVDPRGRRRWCDMAWCGNRAKVRAHAARTRTG